MKSRILLAFTTLVVLVGIARADEPQLPALKEGLWESDTQQVIQKNKFESVLKLCRTCL
jgi:hypothetical protein